jgi:toxin ParE1/3/4
VAFRLSDRARDDINRILAYSFEAYGRDAADRYNLLLTTAIEAVGNHPDLIGTLPVRRKPGVRWYSISFSKAHVPRGQRVRNPGHKLVYRLAGDGVVDILAVVGDSYPSARALRSGVP